MNAAYRLLSWGALSAGVLAAGLVVEKLSTWPTALIGAGAMSLATLPVVFSPVRRMRGLTGETTPPA